MMLEHGAIDGAEEPLGRGVDRIAFRVAGAMSSHRAGFDPAMRTRGTVALLLAFDNLIQAAWHLRCQRDPIDAVAVALEQACRMARSEEHTSELQSIIRSSYAVFCSKINNNQ